MAFLDPPEKPTHLLRDDKHQKQELKQKPECRQNHKQKRKELAMILVFKTQIV